MGKNKNVGCGCNYCMSRGERRDFRHDHGSDGWDETPYRKPGNRKKVCKKSKAGKPCDFTEIVVHYSFIRDVVICEGTTYEETVKRLWEHCVKACSRCGKHDWGNYFTRTRIVR